MNEWIYNGSEGVRIGSIISFSFSGTGRGWFLTINISDSLRYVWRYETANDLNAAIDLIKQVKANE